MAGVAFLGVALLGLLGQGTGSAAEWVWPTLLIVVGLVGLLAAQSRARNRQANGGQSNGGQLNGGQSGETG